MRSKKILSLFMFMMGIFFIFSSKTLAYEIGVYYNGSESNKNENYTEVTGLGGTNTFVMHATKEDGNDISRLVYCGDATKGNPRIEENGYVNWNCSPLSTNADQLRYIFANGYQYKSTMSDSDKNEFFKTQLAVWYYTDSGKIFNNYGKDANGNLDGTYNGSSDSTAAGIAKLVKDAQNYANNSTPSVSVSIDGGDKTMSVTSDGKYYISKAITLGGSNISGNITVTISGPNGAFVTSDKNATTGSSSFANGSKVYIKVPTGSVGDKAFSKLTASGSGKVYTGGVYRCTHVTGSGNVQDIIDYVPSEEAKTATDDITVTATKNMVYISKTDITGSKEIEGAELVIKQGDTKIVSWTSTTTPYGYYLAPGTYTLEETIAPKGYIKSTSKITFVVKDNGKVTVDGKEVTSVVMKNEPITVIISKKSINGKTELPGAKLKITDKDGNILKDIEGNDLEWTSTTKEKSFHLAPGTYYLTETIAPDGYELSDTIIEFTVTEDGKVKMNKKDVDGNLIVFTNTPEATEVKTGSFIIYIVIIGAVAVGLVTYYVMKKQEA